MPDLQSELSKVISEWEAPEPAPAPPTNTALRVVPTRHVSRDTFAYVKAHPGVARIKVVHQMTAQGYNANTVSTLLTQMARQGLLRLDDDGTIHTLVNDYIPIKPKLVREAQMARQAELLKALQAPEAPPHAPQHEPEVGPTPAESAGSFVSKLNVHQAKALYEELKKVFG